MKRKLICQSQKQDQRRLPTGEVAAQKARESEFLSANLKPFFQFALSACK